MSIPVEDVVAIERAGEIFIKAINNGEISALSDFFAPNAMILPPGRGTVKGPSMAGFFSNMALQNEGLKLMSSDMEALGGDAVRDSGTLSMRVKQQRDERVAYKYLMLWHKIGTTWKLSSMMWNRAPQNRQRPGANDEGGM